MCCSMKFSTFKSFASLGSSIYFAFVFSQPSKLLTITETEAPFLVLKSIILPAPEVVINVLLLNLTILIFYLGKD